MELDVRPAAGGQLVLTGRIVLEEPRQPVDLLGGGAPRTSDQIVTLCSWCKAACLPDGGWDEVEQLVASRKLFEEDRLPQISHGICPDCEAAVRAEAGV
jgi:hypothetical protein